MPNIKLIINSTGSRIAVKIMAILLLAVITALGVYSITDNRENFHVGRYDYGKTPPLMLGAITNTDKAYVHLKFRFRADSTEGYPNVFQTAPVNRGMRMEVSGSTAAIIVPDLSIPGGLKGFTLTTTLKTGYWYALEVEALNGAYLHVKLDGQNVVYYASESLSMETSQLLVGGGFDASRVFVGEIKNISVLKGKLPDQVFLYPIILVLLIGVSLFLINKNMRAKLFSPTEREYLKHIDWRALLSVIIIGFFAVTLFTCYFFPIYPDEIQVRFMLSRLPYDFPLKLSGLPTCVSTFTQSMPVTMYVPGLLNWALHGNLVSLHALRQAGFIIPFLWIAVLVYYLCNKVRNSLMYEGGTGSSWRFLHVTGLFCAVFSLGVFPVFLITNRGEQLILPSTVLLIFIFLTSQRLERKGQVWQKWGLVTIYFVAVSLTLYGHAKGLFLTPFFILVGWQLFRQFNNRVLFVSLMMLLGLHVIQDYNAWKYAFQCTDVPKLDETLKSFSLDPAALFYDSQSFFKQAFQSLINFKKYLYQLSFQPTTDAGYLPPSPLGASAKIVNIFIQLNVVVAFFTLLMLLPFSYFQKDIAKSRVVTTNAALLLLLLCVIAGAIFNLPKNWYDAGYLYGLILVIWIFFIGENFSGIFQKPIVKVIYIYLAGIALLSQAVFIHRYFPAFWDGYAGPGIPIVSYNHDEAINDIATASGFCNIDSVNSVGVIVDDYTYLYFQESRQPMPISYILYSNDAASAQRFISEVDSAGIITRCASLPPAYRPFAKHKGNVCCISSSDLNNLPLPF